MTVILHTDDVTPSPTDAAGGESGAAQQAPSPVARFWRPTP